MSRSLVLVLVLLAACSGGRTESVAPAATPEAAVERFLKAVADSNLTAMADIWGTARGPAGVTGSPPDYQKRVAVMQLYLRHSARRVLGIDGEGDLRTVAVELTRDACVSRVPITVGRSSAGAWLVRSVDLAAVGSPTQPCPPGT